MSSYDAGEAFIRFTGDYSGMIEAASAEARRAGDAYAHSFQEELSRNPASVRVDVDAAKASAEIAALRAEVDGLSKNATVKVDADTSRATFQMHALRDTIIALGPAAVPVAAVLSGALIGAVPAALSLALGIKGISDEMKSGALQGTQYGSDISSVKGELSQLETISAGGLLNGLHQGLLTAHPLFAEINRDTAAFSGELGQIVAGGGSAVLSLLHDLDPLFESFGQVLEHGATDLEKWASSGKGVSGFVAYIQAELPSVLQTLGSLATTASHIVQSFAPIGGVVVTELGLVSRAINAIPIPVLTRLEQVGIASYLAFRTYGLISAIVTSVSKAFGSASASMAASSARQQAAALEASATQAAAAARMAYYQSEEAADFAVAAQAAADSAAVITESSAEVASLFGTQAAAAGELAAAMRIDFAEIDSLFASEAELAVTSSATVAAALQAEAAAAAESAAEMVTALGVEATAAEAAADAIVASGEEASLGWAGMLGPIGAVAVGIGILGTALLGGSDDTREATEATNDYTQALIASKGAINDSVRATVAKKLVDDGALGDAQKLGISAKDFTDATLGNVPALDKVRAALGLATASYAGASAPGVKLTQVQKDQAQAAKDLTKILGVQGGAFGTAVTNSKLYLASMAESTGTTNQAAVAAAKLYGLTGTSGVTAYLTAKQAAQQNTEQTKAQTLAWQLAGDAGNLLQQTLDKLSGKKVSYAQADNAFQQQLVSLAQNLKDGSKSLKGLSSDAIANRGDLLNLVTGAQQTADAYGQMTGSTESARKKLVDLRTQIIDNAVAHGEDRAAVTAYVDSLLKIPKKVPPAQLDVDKKAADEKIAQLRTEINNIRQNHDAELSVDTDAAVKRIAQLQILIDGIRGKTVTAAVVATATQGGPGGHSAKGSASWTPDGKLPPNSVSTVGEQGFEAAVTDSSGRTQILSHRQSMALLGYGEHVPGYASGTTPGDVVTLSPSGKAAAAASAAAQTAASKASAKAAKDAKQNLEAAVAALQAFDSAIGFTGSAIKSAENDMLKAAKAAGASSKELNGLRSVADKLTADVARQSSLAAKLGTGPTKPTAFDQLATAEGNFNDLRDSAASAVAGSFSLPGVTGTDATTGTPISGLPGASVTSTSAPTVTFSSILTSATQAAAVAKKFADGLKKLATEGLRKDLVEQLAQAGPDALPQVQALLAATPKQIRALNVQEASIASSASSLGKALATDYFAAGVQSAQGLVAGLKSQEAALEKQMKHLADVMGDRFRHDLGIHSPSAVFHELGSFTGEGLVNGIRQQIPDVRAAMGELAQAHLAVNDMGNRAATQFAAGQNGSGGPYFHMPITQLPNEDGATFADRVSQRVLFYAAR